MSKQLSALTLMLLCFTTFPSAATQDPMSRVLEISQVFGTCVENAKRSTDAHPDTFTCLTDAHAKWNKEVDQSYEALLSILPPDKQEIIRASQLAWIEHQQAEWEAIDASLKPDHDSNPVDALEYLRMRIAQTRAAQLASYLDLAK